MTSTAGLPTPQPDRSSGDSAAVLEGPPVSVLIADRRTTYRCSLLGIFDGEIHILSSERLPEGVRVMLLLERVGISGKIAYCTDKKNHFRVCIESRPDGFSRAEPRFPLTEACTALVLDSRPWRRLTGNLVDFSRSGIGLHLNGPVAIGNMVCVETTSLLLVGGVRHCSQKGADWLIGIETTDIFSDPNAGKRAPVLSRYRQRVAEKILGRPIH